MKRLVPCVWLALTLASACTRGPQGGATSQASARQRHRRPAPGDPLPSWNEGHTENAIRDFVGRVTKEGSPDFVPAPERIATFDNDGTLWAESRCRSSCSSRLIV